MTMTLVFVVLYSSVMIFSIIILRGIIHRIILCWRIRCRRAFAAQILMTRNETNSVLRAFILIRECFGVRAYSAWRGVSCSDDVIVDDVFSMISCVLTLLMIF